jgi:hypothetical protein
MTVPQTTFSLADLATMPVHPAAAIMPMMGPDDLGRLRESMNAQGQLAPLVVVRRGPPFTYSLLDGRNRAAAAVGSSIGLLRADVIEDTDDAVERVVALNVQRRHLNDSQRALIASAWCTLGQGHHARGAAMTQARAAERIGVSDRYVRMAAALRQQAANETLPVAWRTRATHAINHINAGAMSLRAGVLYARPPDRPLPASAARVREADELDEVIAEIAPTPASVDYHVYISHQDPRGPCLHMVSSDGAQHRGGLSERVVSIRLHDVRGGTSVTVAPALEPVHGALFHPEDGPPRAVHRAEVAQIAAHTGTATTDSQAVLTPIGTSHIAEHARALRLSMTGTDPVLWATNTFDASSAPEVADMLDALLVFVASALDGLSEEHGVLAPSLAQYASTHVRASSPSPSAPSPQPRSEPAVPLQRGDGLARARPAPQRSILDVRQPARAARNARGNT